MINRRDFALTLAGLTLPAIHGTALSDTSAGTAPAIDVTLPEAHRGTPKIDMNLLNSYGRQPESVQDFFAEARDYFEKNKQGRFADATRIQVAAEKRGIRHLGGPLVGRVGPDCASIWMRTVRPSRITIRIRNAHGDPVFGPVTTTKASDLTAVIPLTGLRPATRYAYDVFIDDQRIALKQETTFTTFPPPDSKGTFQLAFGGDFHKSGVHNLHLSQQIRERGNQALILTGDLAVDDRNNLTGLHRSDYLLRDLSPAWQALAATLPIYATWDDHDYFDNDLSGIPKNFTARDVDALREIWMQNWNNPGAGENGQGIYFRTRIGPADLIMLDTRSQRKKERNTKNAYLGEQQTQWVKRELLQCRGPFVIISSGTMWSDYISNGKDSWGVFDPAGREELFSFIEANRIPGVLLITSDRHGARGFKIPRPSGYRFHEFEIGCLGGMTGPAAMAPDASTQLFGRTKLKAFGEFEFDTARADPQVRFRLIDEGGAILEQITLKQSELTPG